jgi:glycosyltransferase involved in cell wall biosynthesis
MLEITFWACAVGACFSYLLYPLILLLLPRRGWHGSRVDAGYRPRVTLIIACRNEARRLRAKIENALAIQYPDLEIIVASDASDDESDAIVRGFEPRGVRLVRSPERRGKEHAQGRAIAAAHGEIIVFSDAGTEIPADSIARMVAHFSDPRVGAVSSEDQFVTADGKLAGEGAYVRYEMWLRRLEAAVCSLVGLSGSFFAARRAVLNNWDDSIPSDFATAINTVRTGLIAITDPEVRGIYGDVQDPSREYPRKVRTAVRGMAALQRLVEALNPFKYGVFAFEVFGHKLMRWLVPWFLLGVLVTSALLARDSRGFAALLVAQVCGYLLVLGAHLLPALRRIGVLRIAYYFVQVNLALAHASLKFLRGERVRVWSPTVR